MPMRTNGSFIRSFIHSCNTHSSIRQQPASLCGCWRRFLGIVYIHRAERRFPPAKNGVSGLWSLELGTEWCGPILRSMPSEKKTSELLHVLEEGDTNPQAFLARKIPALYSLQGKVSLQLSHSVLTSKQLSDHPFLALSGTSPQWDALVSAPVSAVSDNAGG